MSWAWDHLVALLKRIWDDFVEFLGDFFIGTMKLFLTAVSAIVNAIPVPSFLANGTLGDYLNGIDPAVLYFLSQSGMAAGMLRASENGYDWLGTGFYFWENNYRRAFDFAHNPPGKKKYKSPSVLGAIIDLENCLDLLDAGYLGMVKKSYEIFTSSAGTEKQELPQNKVAKGSTDKLLRELDCCIIENVHAILRRIDMEPFDSVRGVFVEGEELYPGAGFHSKNHIQICIRNPNCIKGFFIPRQEIDWRG